MPDNKRQELLRPFMSRKGQWLTPQKLVVIILMVLVGIGLVLYVIRLKRFLP